MRRATLQHTLDTYATVIKKSCSGRCSISSESFVIMPRILSLLHHRPKPSSIYVPCPVNRCFSTNNEKNVTPSSGILPQAAQIATVSRSVGQVIFLNSAKSGNIILFSLALSDPTLAALATLGAMTSIKTSKLLGIDEEALKDGLHGYNGTLIGCASAMFTSSLPFAVMGTVAGAVSTPIIFTSLKNAMAVPQWTWSFNIVMMTGLMKSRPLLETESFCESSVDTTSEMEAIQHATNYVDVLTAPLASISQIFVVNSPLSGLGILAATSMYSPSLVLHALGGATTGCIIGFILGDVSDVASGLWGYNSALTSMAIGTFYVDSLEARMLSGGAAAGTAVLFGGVSALTGAYGVPCLTLPFCCTATGEFLVNVEP